MESAIPDPNYRPLAVDGARAFESYELHTPDTWHPHPEMPADDNLDLDPGCLQYCLTPEEASAFDGNGYLLVKEALPPDMVARLRAAVDRLNRKYRNTIGLAEHEPLGLRDFIGADKLFLELLDWPRTFPKVWGILGWHIALYHTHCNITPPLPPAPGSAPANDHACPASSQLGWHQDSGRINIDLEGSPKPRISVKVGYYLTDCTSSDLGLQLVPGSHRLNTLDQSKDDEEYPAGAVGVPAAAGDAVIFDRRVFHASPANHSGSVRMAVFFGYAYRWLRPRDNMTVSHYLAKSGPIRRQLLGAATTGQGYTSPQDEDVPLKTWLTRHLGERAVANVDNFEYITPDVKS